MQPHELAHLLRAAGSIINEKQFIVVGSQSVIGKYPNAPEELLRSNEVDLIAKNKPKETERLNTIGELSQFHQTHGYYADPVDKNTSILPKKWNSRLVNFTMPDSDGVTGLCLDPHDLFVAKVAAGREKDIEYVKVMIEHSMVSMERVIEYANTIPVPEDDLGLKDRVLAKITQLYAGVDQSKTKHVNEQSGRYTGKILSKAESACQQEDGRGNLVFHDLTKLDKEPSLHKVYTIEYKDGKASVTEKGKDQSQTR